MSEFNHLNELLEGIRIAQERRILRALLVEPLPANLIDDLAVFIRGRQHDIENNEEDFGGLNDLLAYFIETKKIPKTEEHNV